MFILLRVQRLIWRLCVYVSMDLRELHVYG